MRSTIVGIGVAVIVLICSNAMAMGYLVQPAPTIYAYMPPAAIAYPAPVVTVPMVDVPVAIAGPGAFVAPPPRVVYPGVAVVRTKVYYRGQPVRNTLKVIAW
jgi:hypothetical protein